MYIFMTFINGRHENLIQVAGRKKAKGSLKFKKACLQAHIKYPRYSFYIFRQRKCAD
jgi:hypothetical protein